MRDAFSFDDREHVHSFGSTTASMTASNAAKAWGDF
jgi:hypothetical protein